MYQAGTLSGNPVAMAAGVATMREMLASGQYEVLRAKTALLAEGVTGAVARTGSECVVNHVTGMLTLFFTPDQVVDVDTATAADHDRFARFFRAMLESGIYIPPVAFRGVVRLHGPQRGGHQAHCVCCRTRA